MEIEETFLDGRTDGRADWRTDRHLRPTLLGRLGGVDLARVPGAIAWRCSRDPTFSRFDRTPDL